VERPLDLLLASNFLPPFYTRPPSIGGERYGDGALSDNLPYEKAFDEGCDAVVLVPTRGESAGPLGRRLGEPRHLLPERLTGRTVVIGPRHALPIGFTDRSWPAVERVMDLGRLRTREVLLGERWPETDARREVHPARELMWKAVHRVAALRAA
jgi:predicted patatin/cPLA2 family phospholipase